MPLRPDLRLLKTLSGVGKVTFSPLLKRLKGQSFPKTGKLKESEWAIAPTKNVPFSQRSTKNVKVVWRGWG
jgi:hypothetical protein